MNFGINCATVLLSHEGINNEFFISASVRCTAVGGKGNNWDDVLQACVFYPFSIYYRMDLEKFLGTVSWQDKSCTSLAGLKGLWLTIQQFGSLIKDDSLQKICIFYEIMSFECFFLLIFDDLLLILREFIFFLLRKLSCFLPLSLIKRLANRLTETAVAYLSLSNSKEQTLNEQSLKWSHGGFFRNNSVVSWLNSTFYTPKSLYFCNCNVKYNLYFRALSWGILKKYIKYMYKLSLFLMLLKQNTKTVKNYLIYLLIRE